MRLETIRRGVGLRSRFFIAFAGFMMKAPANGFFLTMIHRKHFFAKRSTDIGERVMRGPSPWSIGERELFAAFASRLNQCLF